MSVKANYWEPEAEAQRFWTRVKISEHGCWEWHGPRNNAGYGMVQSRLPGFGTTSAGAHRVAFTLVNGPIPAGMVICHHCDNPPCVRPDHLFVGTYADNYADAQRKGRASSPPPGRHRGTEIHNARLDEDKVRRIRLGALLGMAHAALAREYGVSESAIWHAVHRRHWGWVA